MTAPDWSARRTAFGTEAPAYSYGRPSYPVDAIRWALPDDARTVLDLAAGTGKLTQPLLSLGLDVIAVEPLEEMRAEIPAAARAMPGTAESIPLGDASVDAVVVGQAFHWFDPTLALPEIARVLRPGGALGLFWNLDDDRPGRGSGGEASRAWVDELSTVTASEARASNMSPDAQPMFTGRSDLSTPTRASFDFAETYDADRVVACIASRSQIILMPVDERTRLLDRVRALCPAGEFPFPMVCEVWRSTRLRRNP